jgi:ribosomal protein S18 acetylase RimI-like enzyme
VTAPVVVPIGPDLVAEVARVHRDAFPGSALSALGTEAVGRYYRWQFADRHDSVVLGAFDGGRMVGFCVAGVFRGALSGFVRANRWFLARAVLARPWLAMRASALVRGGRALRTPFSPPGSPTGPPSFGVLAVAVEPAYRRRGVGRALLDAAEAAAQAAGFDRMHLTVSATNEEAVRFYTACGWTSAADRMEKRLGAPQTAEPEQ